MVYYCQPSLVPPPLQLTLRVTTLSANTTQRTAQPSALQSLAHVIQDRKREVTYLNLREGGNC